MSIREPDTAYEFTGKRLFRLLLPIVGLFFLTVGYVVVKTVNQTNQIEAARSRLAVAAAIRTEIDSVAEYTRDNARWDDAARAVYSNKLESSYILRSWADSTEDARYADRFNLFGSDGKPIMSYRNGRRVTQLAAADFAREATALSSQLGTTNGARAGLARNNGHLFVVAIANVGPSSLDLVPQFPVAMPARLMFVKPFPDATFARIGKSLELEAMIVSAKGDSATSIALNSASGSPLGYVDWKPIHSGTKALWDIMPLLLLACFMHLGIAGYATLKGFSSIAKLGQQATIDPLSKLPNRRALRSKLIGAARSQEPITLAMLDLDGFKSINDHFGHSVGDKLIQACAAEIQKIIGTDAYSARLGGDEFAILWIGQDTHARADAAAAQLLERLALPIDVSGHGLTIGVSIGLVDATLREIDPAEVMRRADVAMYAAKKAGKMRRIWFKDTHDIKGFEAAAIARDIQVALKNDEFSVVYQPVVSALDGRITSLEALIRWFSASRGEVPPSVFIPIADRSGLIDQLGAVVLRTVAKDSRQWPGIRVAINMSRAQMRAPDFAGSLKKRLHASGLPADRIEIEIRESLFLADSAHAEKLSAEVRALGAVLSLDDFGSGYVSLDILRRGGFSKMKLDPALVQDSETNATSLAILQGSIAVAKSLGIKVVAEGIESDSQAQLMRVAGCDELQGWQFSRALDAYEVSTALSVQALRVA